MLSSTGVFVCFMHVHQKSLITPGMSRRTASSLRPCPPPGHRWAKI